MRGQFVFDVGAALTYLIIFGDTAVSSVEFFVAKPCKHLRLACAGAGLAALPPCLLRDVSGLEGISLFSVAAVFAATGVVISELCTRGSKRYSRDNGAVRRGPRSSSPGFIRLRLCVPGLVLFVLPVPKTKDTFPVLEIDGPRPRLLSLTLCIVQCSGLPHLRVFHVFQHPERLSHQGCKSADCSVTLCHYDGVWHPVVGLRLPPGGPRAAPRRVLKVPRCLGGGRASRLVEDAWYVVARAVGFARRRRSQYGFAGRGHGFDGGRRRVADRVHPAGFDLLLTGRPECAREAAGRLAAFCFLRIGRLRPGARGAVLRGGIAVLSFASVA